MADFLKAVTITLEHEGGFAHNKTTGEIVNMGVTSTWLSAHSMPSDEAAVLALTPTKVKSLYFDYFWVPLYCEGIQDQDLAAKLFDVDVNQGGIAVMELQSACNELSVKLTAVGLPAPELTVDGQMGPKTVELVNLLATMKLTPSLYDTFLANVATRYRLIAGVYPALAVDLGSRNPPKGWLGRLYS